MRIGGHEVRLLLLLRVLQIGVGVGLVGVGLRIGFLLVGRGLRDGRLLVCLRLFLGRLLVGVGDRRRSGSLACANAADDRQPAINAATSVVFVDWVMLMGYLR